jgi:hypothetical protein
MPLTAHRPDAADLLEHGTYTLRHALNRIASRSERLVAEQFLRATSPLKQVARQDPPGDVAAPHHREVAVAVPDRTRS